MVIGLVYQVQKTINKVKKFVRVLKKGGCYTEMQDDLNVSAIIVFVLIGKIQRKAIC